MTRSVAMKQGAKTRKTKTGKPVRKRNRPRQIYLSAEEDRIFEAMLARYKLNGSQLVRRWLLRAQAQFSRRQAGVGAALEEDPRQLRIAITGAAETR